MRGATRTGSKEMGSDPMRRQATTWMVMGPWDATCIEHRYFSSFLSFLSMIIYFQATHSRRLMPPLVIGTGLYSHTGLWEWGSWEQVQGSYLCPLAIPHLCDRVAGLLQDHAGSCRIHAEFFICHQQADNNTTHHSHLLTTTIKTMPVA